MIASILTEKGCQSIHYGLWIHSPWIIHYAKPKIVEALLTHICWIGQQACRILFDLQRQPIISLWKDVTRQYNDCDKYNHTTYGLSIDAHIDHILTVIECSIIVCQSSYSHY